MHRACFKCAGGCGKGLAGKQNVVNVGGKAFCDLCALKGFTSAQPKLQEEASKNKQEDLAKSSKQAPSSFDDDQVWNLLLQSSCFVEVGKKTFRTV